MKPLPHFARVFGVCVMLGTHGAAQCAPEGLSADPTRPPTVVPGVPGGEKHPQGRILQSVRISPGRAVAVIDGELVRVGSRLGDAQVVKIDESGVVLRSSDRTETLMLLPDVKKYGSRVSRHNAIEERVK